MLSSAHALNARVQSCGHGGQAVAHLQMLPIAHARLATIRNTCFKPTSAGGVHRPQIVGQRSSIITRCQTGDSSLPSSQPGSVPERKKSSGLFGFGALVLLAAAGAFQLSRTGQATILKEQLAKTWFGQSGFLAALSLIFMSEIGDKTFFIAALLAAKFGKWLSFTASVASLSIMTVISVAIGQTFRRVPSFMHTSAPVVEYAGAALLVYFGLRTIKDAWDTPDDADGDELAGAQDSIEEAEKTGRISGQTVWQAWAQVAMLIFVAEWGDRSMLATIALAFSQSATGVAAGAIVGHAVATVLAVVGGAIASKYISEKNIGYIGGSLFLVFAALTVTGIF